MQVGKRIKELREENGISQNKLAKKVGFNQSQICKIENGDRYLKAEELELFAIAFSIPIGELLENKRG